MNTGTTWILRPADLTLFGGEGAAGGETGGAPADSGDAGRGTKSGGAEAVRYGRQPAAQTPPDAGEAAGAPAAEPVEGVPETPEEKRKRFRALVTGEFRDIYTEDTQHIINQRFRETRELQERAEQTRPLLDMLAQRYGVADGDPAKLAAAVEADDQYWSQAADDAGMDVAQFKRVKRLERENARLLAEQQARVGRDRAEAQYRQWVTEAEAVKAGFPDFDLAAEAQNPQFVSMLRAGVPMEHAYKVMHMESIVADSIRTTAAEAEKRVVDSVRARGTRPRENGTRAQGAFTIKSDVDSLTKQDLEEIRKRVKNGEKIRF